MPLSAFKVNTTDLLTIGLSDMDPPYPPHLQQCCENICKIKHYSPISIFLYAGKVHVSYLAQKRTFLISWNDLLSVKRDFALSGNGCT